MLYFCYKEILVLWFCPEPYDDLLKHVAGRIKSALDITFTYTAVTKQNLQN